MQLCTELYVTAPTDTKHQTSLVIATVFGSWTQVGLQTPSIHTFSYVSGLVLRFLSTSSNGSHDA